MTVQEGNQFHQSRISENSRVQRVKITPNYRLNNNYLLPANKLIYSSQEILPPIQTEMESDTEFEIKPTIKRTCARCKESNKCVKMIRSRIHRLEELVNNIAKTTDNYYTGIKERQTPQQSLQFLPYSIQSDSKPASNVPISFYDISNFSMEDLQLVISAITNNMMISNRNT
ncbi:7967_t:CDS:2 [Funneliformis mosseae]|uniref:7967_t:CDS:1 n=1 Tax=Funneliformis mosseae TaxID=27381 RepID=A0A9N9AAJ6_FUNMO|nr:7967_t:CDS:2 [Funneliformis mosseae]